ncbi:MEDS domain-containing protein [Streptomyces sp. MST-110588]|uniref:MEDS domain-containing protein n=1 Tax=Streptomyces sp. MST-110588 TaxID=2833628 RepID=UPI001F5E1D80|nr:MEDS domain-containing protein [Streptomyces sp. MST-110588]UNO40488.1 MEDS domain-containing protein [Streptomyces sp. MST-110588]
MPVERLRPGDHAFASYADEESRWSTLGAFTQTGITKGERVLLFPDPALAESTVLAQLLAYGPPVESALERGQLLLLTMDQMWLPHPLSVERQMAGLHREIERAQRDGYGAVRSAIDMAWVPSFGADIERVMWRETSGCHYLFADSRYTEICTYDRAWFDEEVLDRAAAGHPTVLMERPGSLLAVAENGSGGGKGEGDGLDDGRDGGSGYGPWSGSGSGPGSDSGPGAGSDETYGLKLIGDADLSTREQFNVILRGIAASGARRIVLDLTELSFLDVYCARALLRLAAYMEPSRHVDIRCGGIHAHTFLLMGALDIPQLTVEGE